MTRSLHPPMAHCGQRVRFAATWREEFFEVPIYWFNISPDRQVEFDRSSSPAALNEGDRGRLEETQAVKEFVEQEIQ